MSSFCTLRLFLYPFLSFCLVTHENILNFTFTLSCIVIEFFNNQSDTLIIPILFCYKNLHVSGIFSAHHQEFCTVHSALVSFMQVSDDRFQAASGRNSCSILTLLGSGQNKIGLISASGWLFKKKYMRTCFFCSFLFR